MAESEDILTIFLSLRGRLARAVRGIVPPTEVEDIVQETYVRVCQADNAGPIHSPRSFMYKTARNLALDHVRSAQYRLSDRVEDPDGWDSTSVPGIGDRTFGQVTSNEEFGRFCEAVRQLPTQCRRVFVLKKVYGYSQREIARATGLSESTVEKHIAKGIRRCRDFLLQYVEASTDRERSDGDRQESGRQLSGQESRR